MLQVINLSGMKIFKSKTSKSILKTREYQYNKNYLEYSSQEKVFTSQWPEDRKIVEKVFRSLKKGKVLDIGCGPGDDVANIFAKGFDACGVDKSSKLIKQAQESYSNIANRFRIGRLEKLPFKKHEFDYVYSRFAIHYAINLDGAFKEIHRVLKTNGRAFLLLSHPVLQLSYKNNSDYHTQEIIRLPIYQGLVVDQPSHSFADYLSDSTLDLFEVSKFLEAEKTYRDIQVGTKLKKVPTFFYLELRKK